MVTIYALVEKATKTIVYVGRTKNVAILQSPHEWKARLKRANLNPEMFTIRILAVNIAQDLAVSTQGAWIRCYHPPLNVHHNRPQTVKAPLQAPFDLRRKRMVTERMDARGVVRRVIRLNPKRFPKSQ